MVKIGFAFATCYWLWVGKLTAHELMAGALACGLSTGFSMLLRRSRESPLRLTRLGFVAARAICAIPGESWAVVKLLFRAVRRRPAGPIGTLRLQPFRAGGRCPEDIGRRALVIWGNSLGPDQFVADLQETGEGLYVHRLSCSPASDDREWPV